MDSVKFKFVQEVTQYGDKLLKRLDEFRRKNLYYDVRIKTIDDEFVAHKVVLAACGGVFRRNFVDPNTMMIIGDVTEVTFDCCSIGLSPILNFAYSGILEITAENLIPVFVASGSTEMKEVQDICAGLTMERLGWIIDFDGKQSLCDVTIEESLAKLEKTLRINLKSFGESPVGVEGEFPCLSHVEETWPELGVVYKLLVDCVKKAKVIDDGNKVNNKPDEVVTVDTTPTKKEFATQDTKQEPEKTEVKEPKLPATQESTSTENSKSTTEITKDETIKESTKEATKELEDPKTPAKEDPKTPAKEDPKTPANEDPKTPANEDPKLPAKPPNINGN
uniref:BTB domain-containing protein n=2 Tax=Ciona intestinalis TaxID=7719 RepID=F6W9P9_CIOIN